MRTRFGWVALGLLAAGVGLAQEGDALEIRGYVAEMGLNAGIGGVQITVYQFSKESERSVFATGSTDALGNFIFHPSQAGVYYVEARKLEYLATVGYKGPTDKLPDVTGSVISLSRDHPREFVRFVMMRLGEMTGRVVDENEKPM